MGSILVVFPTRETARKIRQILAKGGYETAYACTTGAQTLQYADSIGAGLVVCGYKMPDMMYTELRECLPPAFDMLVAGIPEGAERREEEHVVYLPPPVKGYELINTVGMILEQRYRRRKQKKESTRLNSEEVRVIRQAKALLMERNGMTEAQAHKYLQKCSMDSGTRMTETAEMVLTVMEQ